MDASGNVGLALLLPVMAGLSTGIGSTIAYLVKKPKLSYLSFSLGFSAGVMIFISFVELLPEAVIHLGKTRGIMAFFIGIVSIGLIDLLIPEEQNPHHYVQPSDVLKLRGDRRLLRTGLLTALTLGIHNLPEGIVIFSTALSNVKLSVFLALAIAIHNVPEGISISVPIFYATGSRRKAFAYSFLSGLAEPLGAIVCYLFLMPLLLGEPVSWLLAYVSGIMVYISVDELLPMAHRYGHSHTVIVGIILGMLLMAVSSIVL
jgi:ZIP family zinc transporter